MTCPPVTNLIGSLNRRTAPISFCLFLVPPVDQKFGSRTEVEPQFAKMACFEELAPENFAQKLSTVFNNAALSMALGIGNSVGLFDAMGRLEKPETSDGIAKEAGLVERYVRELLGVLVTSQIVNYNKEDKSYFLPRNYLPFLTHGSQNMTAFSSLLLMVSVSQDDIVSCFKNGGGVPYSKFTHFHAWMNDFSTRRHEAGLISHYIPSIEGIKQKLESGIRCLDIGCGSGSPSLIMAAAFPKSEFYGFDFSEEAIKTATENAEKRNLKNVHFKVQDVTKIDDEFKDYFDFVSAFDTIHDQAHPAKALSEAFKVLKKDGLFSMVDIDAHSDVGDNVSLPFAPLKYSISLFHCMPVSLYFDGGAGLGVCWGRELAMEMLATAGFKDSEIIPLAKDMMNLHILSTK